MKKYYISNGQENFGPLTEQEIMEAVRKGQINLFDMIFHDQLSEWVMLIQHPDFSDQGSEEINASEEKSHIVLGLLSVENSQENTNNAFILDEDTPELTAVCWHIKNDPDKELTFLDVLFLLSTKKISEHSLISKNRVGPWLPLAKWE
ncbi:MAG TPA: GYF domain-containing protein, partial [Pseudobdellovibrionaceae bacterium]